MAVSKELISELQIIIREDYGQELELREVSVIANNLVKYFDLLAKIHHKGYENEHGKLPSLQ